MQLQSQKPRNTQQILIAISIPKPRINTCHQIFIAIRIPKQSQEINTDFSLKLQSQKLSFCVLCM